MTTTHFQPSPQAWTDGSTSRLQDGKTPSPTQEAANQALRQSTQLGSTPSLGRGPLPIPGPTLSLSSRESQPRLAGNPTGMFRSVQMENSNGELKTYWIWATVTVNVNGRTLTQYAQITDTDNDLHENLAPVLNVALRQQSGLKNKQLNITYNSQKNNANGYTNSLTIGAHEEPTITTTVEANEDQTLQQQIDNVVTALGRVTNPSRTDPQGRQVPLLSQEQFNQVTQGANPASTAAGSSSSSSSSSQANKKEEDLSENPTISAEEALKQKRKLTINQMGDLLKKINKKSKISIQNENSENQIEKLTISKKIQEPHFIPFKDIQPNESKKYFLCVTPQRDVYVFSPLGESLFDGKANSKVKNGTGLLRNRTAATDLFHHQSKSGSGISAKIARFCLNNNCRSIQVGSPPSGLDNDGVLGLSWFEHLNKQFSNLRPFNRSWDISTPFDSDLNPINYRNNLSDRLENRSPEA